MYKCKLCGSTADTETDCCDEKMQEETGCCGGGCGCE